MATYTTDLQTVHLADNDTGWSELSGHTSGGAPAADSENYIHNGSSVSQATGQASGTTAGMQYDYGSNITWTSGDVFIAWQYYAAPTNLNSWATGGMRFGVGSTAGNMRFWNALGDDFGDYPYGGWQSTAIDPEVTGDAADGTPVAGTYRYFGSLPNVRAKITKGSPHAVDAIRYGRGEIKASGTGCTFSGMAAANDATTARWGLFAYKGGSYLWKGRMTIGSGLGTHTFTDSNATIRVDDTPRVAAGFNEIYIYGTTTVNWTSINFIGVQTSITGSAPISPGDMTLIAGVTVNLKDCSFTDMGTFSFLRLADLDGCTFRRCGEVTLGNAYVTNCLFAETTAAVALNCGVAFADLTNCDFVSDGSSHAMEITGGTSHTLNGLTFTGYEAYQAGGTSTGNEAVYVNIPSGTVTLYADNQFSYRTAGATVTIIAGAVDITVTAIDINGAAVNDVSVALYAKDGTGDLPYIDSVSISNSGTTATVTHTAHGMVTGDKVLIEAGDQPHNRGVFTITVTDANTYTYTCASAPTGDPTGCIATWAAIYEELSSTNTVTANRTFASNQPVSGWVRKSTSAPFYQSAPISGVINSTTGVSLTALMLSDE